MIIYMWLIGGAIRLSLQLLLRKYQVILRARALDLKDQSLETGSPKRKKREHEVDEEAKVTGTKAIIRIRSGRRHLWRTCS